MRKPVLIDRDFVLNRGNNPACIWEDIPVISSFKHRGFEFKRTWGGTTVDNFMSRITYGYYYTRIATGTLKGPDNYILVEFVKGK